jgi:hypothetical protein
VPNEIIHLILGSVTREAFQKLGEVFLAIEVVASLGRVVEIPRGLLQFFECG